MSNANTLPQSVREAIEREAEAIASRKYKSREGRAISRNNYKLAATVWAERCERLAKSVESLLEFYGDDLCRFDHNDNCQEHGSFGYDGGCDVRDARDTLAEYRASLGVKNG